VFGAEARPPSAFTTFELPRKAFPDTSVVLLSLTPGSHRNALDCCQKLLTEDPSLSGPSVWVFY